MVKEGVLAEGPRMEGGWTDASPRNGGSKVSKDEQDASQASPRPERGRRSGRLFRALPARRSVCEARSEHSNRPSSFTYSSMTPQAMVVAAGISSTTLLSLVTVPSSAAETCGRQHTLCPDTPTPLGLSRPTPGLRRMPWECVERRSRDFIPTGL